MSRKKFFGCILGIVIVLGALFWGIDFVKHQTVFTTIITLGVVVAAFIGGMWFWAWYAKRTRKEPRYSVK